MRTAVAYNTDAIYSLCCAHTDAPSMHPYTFVSRITTSTAKTPTFPAPSFAAAERARGDQILDSVMSHHAFKSLPVFPADGLLTVRYDSFQITGSKTTVTMNLPDNTLLVIGALLRVFNCNASSFKRYWAIANHI